MKVGRSSRGGESAGGIQTSAKGTKSEKPDFVAAIEGAMENQMERDLDDLFEKITVAAETLSRKRTAGALDDYRDLVTSFMKLVVDKALKVKEVPSARFMDNNKVFMIAEKIEAKLMEMAEKIRSGEAQAMDIAAATSDIRGWLFDMRI